MVYLRSEEHLARWLGDNGWQAGATLPADRLNALARTWYRTRLDPGWRPRPLEESQAILAGLGLGGEFWRLG